MIWFEYRSKNGAKVSNLFYNDNDHSLEKTGEKTNEVHKTPTLPTSKRERNRVEFSDSIGNVTSLGREN